MCRDDSSASVAGLAALMGGAHGLAQRVWDAGWRPAACHACRLAARAMALWLAAEEDER